MNSIENFSEYTCRALATAKPNIMKDPMYTMLGIIGETGEIAEKIKKAKRDGQTLDRDLLGNEIGDLLWYVNKLCHDYGFTLAEVAKLNIDKLESRKRRNKISGNGDRR
jgi:NTP pyrophosphatase (non-canonical NTP hydrolase)